MTIGERIKQARKEKGITQEQLAEMVGIDQSAIAKYEKGKREPSLETIGKIVRALEVPYLSIITADEFSLGKYFQPADQAGIVGKLCAYNGFQIETVYSEDFEATHYLVGQGQSYQVTSRDLERLDEKTHEYFEFELDKLIKELETRDNSKK